MYTLRGLQYILQVYCYFAEVYVQYGHNMQGTLKAAVYGTLNCQYILQVHCIDGSIPSVYTAAY